MSAAAAGAAGASIGLAAASPFIEGAFGLLGQGMNYYFNKKLASQQNQYNIDMWKMQAEYNSPQAQMQRFQEAGLNPNLIYSQGNNGNMSQAPQMVTPNAPDVSKAMQALSRAFNIEQLRTIVANRKNAEEKANQAHLETKNMEDDRLALSRFGDLYEYDLNTGRFVRNVADVVTSRDSGLPAYDIPTDLARMHRYLASMDPRMQTLGMQRAYLAPQVFMAEYDKRFYPYSYWIGNVGKGVKAVSDITGMFNPSRYLMPIGVNNRGFITPFGRTLYY